MKKFLIILLFMILPNLASFCNKAGGLSEDAYNNEGEYTQQEEDKKKVKWEVIKKNIEKEVHDYYNNTMNDVTDRTKKLVNEIEIGAERDKKNKYFKEEVEQKGIAFKKKTKDLKYAFSKLFPYRKKEFTNMEFRYKINKEIILYADMVENVTKGQLIKKSKNYYDTFLEASKHVITFAYVLYSV